MSLILPFKPFTLDEVAAITGAPAKLIDAWTGIASQKVLPWRYSNETDTAGLDYMQTFALFCGWKYVQEGMSVAKATIPVQVLGTLNKEFMLKEFGEGRVFPYINRKTGAALFVPRPDTTLGRRLSLDTLYAEFKMRMKDVFPDFNE